MAKKKKKKEKNVKILDHVISDIDEQEKEYNHRDKIIGKPLVSCLPLISWGETGWETYSIILAEPVVINKVKSDRFIIKSKLKEINN